MDMIDVDEMDVLMSVNLQRAGISSKTSKKR
jgi:hypothetical protein